MRTATVFNFLVEATLIGSALILGILLARPLCRRRVGSRVLLLAWLLVALRLLTPLALPNPAMNWLKPTLSQDAGIRPMADQVRTRVEDAARGLYWKTMGSQADQTPLQAFLRQLVNAAGDGRVSRLAFQVYLAGAGLAALWMLAQGGQFLRLMRRQRRGAFSPEDQAVLEEMCRVYGLGRIPQGIMVEGLHGGCSLALPRMMILLPTDVRREDVPAILRREVCSLKRRDGWWMLVRNLCCAVHWFNPLVWLAAHRMRLDAALAADEYALTRCDPEESRAYAGPLLHMTDTRRARPSVVVGATPMTLGDRAMRQRIRLILHPPSPRRAGQGAFLAVCAVAMVAMFATAERSSVANVPEVSPCLRTAEVALTAEAEALAYAEGFLALEGVDGAEDFLMPTLFKDAWGWTVQWYPPEQERPGALAFTEDGRLLGYDSGADVLTGLKPLARPITTASGEGQRWCAFLSAFLTTHLPEIWQEYQAMDIVRSGRLDGEQYIVVDLLDEGREPLWQLTVQVAPTGRILSLVPVNG